jgi:hypothetical protein
MGLHVHGTYRSAIEEIAAVPAFLAFGHFLAKYPIGFLAVVSVREPAPIQNTAWGSPKNTFIGLTYNCHQEVARSPFHGGHAFCRNEKAGALVGFHAANDFSLTRGKQWRID